MDQSTKEADDLALAIVMSLIPSPTLTEREEGSLFNISKVIAATMRSCNPTQLDQWKEVSQWMATDFNEESMEERIDIFIVLNTCYLEHAMSSDSNDHFWKMMLEVVSDHPHPVKAILCMYPFLQAISSSNWEFTVDQWRGFLFAENNVDLYSLSPNILRELIEAQG